MLREHISAALKTSIKSKEACATATLRLISAAIKDRDIAAREEIAVIERFLPAQMSADEIVEAVETVIKDTGADCIKDMGKCMGALKQKYAGRMDFSKASALVKDKLC